MVQVEIVTVLWEIEMGGRRYMVRSEMNARTSEVLEATIADLDGNPILTLAKGGVRVRWNS